MMKVRKFYFLGPLCFLYKVITTVSYVRREGEENREEEEGRGAPKSLNCGSVIIEDDLLDTCYDGW